MPLKFSHRFLQEETVLFSAKLKSSIFYIDFLCQQIDKGENFAKNGIRLQKVQEHLNVISSEFGSCSKVLDDKWVLINCVLLVLCDFYDKTERINSNHSSLSAQLRFNIKNHLKIVIDSCKEDSLKTIIKFYYYSFDKTGAYYKTEYYPQLNVLVEFFCEHIHSVPHLQLSKTVNLFFKNFRNIYFVDNDIFQQTTVQNVFMNQFVKICAPMVHSKNIVDLIDYIHTVLKQSIHHSSHQIRSISKLLQTICTYSLNSLFYLEYIIEKYSNSYFAYCLNHESISDVLRKAVFFIFAEIVSAFDLKSINTKTERMLFVNRCFQKMFLCVYFELYLCDQQKMDSYHCYCCLEEMLSGSNYRYLHSKESSLYSDEVNEVLYESRNGGQGKQFTFNNGACYFKGRKLEFSRNSLDNSWLGDLNETTNLMRNLSVNSDASRTSSNGTDTDIESVQRYFNTTKVKFAFDDEFTIEKLLFDSIFNLMLRKYEEKNSIMLKKFSIVSLFLYHYAHEINLNERYEIVSKIYDYYVQCKCDELSLNEFGVGRSFFISLRTFYLYQIITDDVIFTYFDSLFQLNNIVRTVIINEVFAFVKDDLDYKFHRSGDRENEILRFYYNFLYYALIKYKKKLLKFDILNTVNKLNQLVKKKNICDESDVKMKEKVLKKLFLRLLLKSSNINDFEKFFKWKEFVDCSSINSFILKKYKYLNKVSVHTSYLLQNSKQAKTLKKSHQEEQFFLQLLLLFCFSTEHNICYNVYHNQLNVSKQFEQTFSAASLKLMQDMILSGYIAKNGSGFCLLFSHMLLHLCQNWYFTDSILNLSFVILNLVSKSLHKGKKYTKKSLFHTDSNEDVFNSLEYNIQIEFSAEILAFGDAFTKLNESTTSSVSPFNILFYSVLNYVSTFFTVAYKKDKYMSYLNLYLAFLNDVDDIMYDSWIFIQLRKMLTVIFKNITSNLSHQDACYYKYYGDFDSGCMHVNMGVLTKIIFSLSENDSVNLTEHWTELFTHGHYNVNYDMGYQLIVHYFNGKRYYEKFNTQKPSQKSTLKNFILSKIFNILKNKIYKYLSVEELLIKNNSWFLVNSFVGFLTVFFTCVGDTEFSGSIYKAIEAHFTDSELLFVRYISKLCDLINQMQLVIIQNESLFQFRIVQFVMNCRQMLNLVDVEFREDANSMINFCCTMVCSQLTLLKGHISMTIMNYINTKNVSIQIPFLLPILYDSEHFTFDEYANIKSKTREEICLLQLSKVINHRQNVTIVKDFLRHVYDEAVARKKNTYNKEHLKCYYERVSSLSKYLTNMIISQEIKINFSELFKWKHDFVYLLISIEDSDGKQNYETDEYKDKIVHSCVCLINEMENQSNNESNYYYYINELEKIKNSFCAEKEEEPSKKVEPAKKYNLIEKYKGFFKKTSKEMKSNIYSDEQIIDCLLSNNYANSNQYNEMIEYIVRESGTFGKNTNYLLNKEGCALSKFNIFCSLLNFALKKKNFDAAENLLDIIITLEVANENYVVCKLVSICRKFSYNKVYTGKYATHLTGQIAKIENGADDPFITRKYVELAKRKLQLDSCNGQKSTDYSAFFVNSGSSYSFVLKELKKNKKFVYEKLKFKINTNLNEKLEVIKFDGHNLDVQLNAKFMSKIATSFKYSTSIQILKIYIEMLSNSKITKHEEIDMIWLNIVLILNWYRQNYKALLNCSAKCDSEDAIVYTYTLRLILKFAIVLLNRAYRQNSTISVMSKIQYLVDFYEFLIFSVNQNVLLCQVIDHLTTIFGLIKSKYELQEQVDVLVSFLLLTNENYDKLIKKNNYINKKVRALFILISRILAESNYLVIDYNYIGKVHEFFIKLSNNYFDKNSMPLILNSNKATYENYSLYFYFYRCNCKLKDQLEIRENPALSNFYTSFKECNKKVEEYLVEIDKFVNYTNFKRYIKLLADADDISMENPDNLYQLLSHFNLYIKFIKKEQFQKLLSKLLPKKKEFYYYMEFLMKNKKFKAQHCFSLRFDLHSMIDDLSSDSNFISHNNVNKLINSQLFNDVILTKMDNYARIFSWVEKILEAMSRVLNKLNGEYISVVNKNTFFTSLHLTYMRNLCLNYIHFFNIIYQILSAFIHEQYEMDENGLLEKLLNKLCSMLSMYIDIDIDRMVSGMQHFDDTIKYIKFN